MTTKIHASGDALGNPTGFHLTPGQACDRDGSDVLLPDILGSIEAFLADKAYDAQERVLNLLEKAGVKIVIPPKSSVSHLSRSCFGAEIGRIVDRPAQVFDGLIDAQEILSTVIGTKAVVLAISKRRNTRMPDSASELR